MSWFVRRVRKKGRSQLSYEHSTVESAALTIGRGTDQDVVINDVRVALAHAELRESGKGRFRVEAKTVAGIRVNGHSTSAAPVKQGSLIEIGPARIRLVSPPAGFDGAVEVQLVDARVQARDRADRAAPMSLRETWLSRRRLAWIGISVVALFGLALPLLGHFLPSIDASLGAHGLSPRAFWQSGEVASAHHFFAADCGNCHRGAFVPVEGRTCIGCHRDTLAHADPVEFPLPELISDCRSCHREHNGADGLAPRGQRFCADCHGDLAAHPGVDTKLADVADFGREHPEFAVTLMDSGATGFKARRVRLGTPEAREDSGLKFPHALHLDAGGIAAPSGKRQLDCKDCHRLEPGGARMQPIEFETMCQSCHALTFDVTEPDRQVPHADIEAIIYTLDEFYARRALDGTIKDPTAPATFRTRRRPGQPVTREIRQEAFTWARDRSRRVAESLFTGRACSICHAVTPGETAEEPWRVKPARVAGEWFTAAHFDHGRHRTMECADCHEARTSEASADVLLPGIATCRTCHAGEAGGRNLLETTCTACHGFHEAAGHPMAQAAGITADPAAARISIPGRPPPSPQPLSRGERD